MYMGPQSRHGSKGGVLDHGLSVTSKDPSKGGALDHGQFETSSNPSKGGLLDVGRFKIHVHVLGGAGYKVTWVLGLRF